MITWRHTCRFIYAGGQRPAPIDIENLDRCPYCGDINPVRQAEVDAAAAALLAKAHQSVNNQGVNQSDLHASD